MNRLRKRAPSHPGEILKRHYLEPLELTIAQVSGALRISRKTLSKIINERRAVTPENGTAFLACFQNNA
jgi:addiction module HigA family antidote